jgi:hypothetical protein
MVIASPSVSCEIDDGGDIDKFGATRDRSRSRGLPSGPGGSCEPAVAEIEHRRLSSSAARGRTARRYVPIARYILSARAACACDSFIFPAARQRPARPARERQPRPVTDAGFESAEQRQPQVIVVRPLQFRRAT